MGIEGRKDMKMDAHDGVVLGRAVVVALELLQTWLRQTSARYLMRTWLCTEALLFQCCSRSFNVSSFNILSRVFPIVPGLRLRLRFPLAFFSLDSCKFQSCFSNVALTPLTVWSNPSTILKIWPPSQPPVEVTKGASTKTSSPTSP